MPLHVQDGVKYLKVCIGKRLEGNEFKYYSYLLGGHGFVANFLPFILLQPENIICFKEELNIVFTE
jgi:hypothetical protein